jgi:hypothetical protein
MLVIDIDVGRRRVVGRPRDDDRSLYAQLLEARVENGNVRLGRALRGKQMTLVGNDRESDVESRDLQGRSPPYVSVKDRWVDSHEYILNVLITCWRYEHNKQI